MPEPLLPAIRALLTIRLTPHVGPRTAAALLDHFGSPERVVQASLEELRRVEGVGERAAQALVRMARQGQAEVDAEAERAAKQGVRLLGVRTLAYPTSLSTIPDPPPILYVRGAVLPEDVRAVALVGTRHPTDYGRRMATRLAEGLVRAGYVVVSGLARGIDGAAHKAALNAGGRTLAVLAGGLSRIYPPEHRGLADEVEKRGALLTEAEMPQDPVAGLFPQRNRIISGLSRAVVLVEAAEKSGALITAEHAAEQGRCVLAVPGPADSEASGGCNALLRQGAVLCRHVEDIIEEIHGVSAVVTAAKKAEGEKPPPPPAPVPTTPPPGLDDNQKLVWDALGDGPRHVDELVQRLKLAAGPLTGMLLMMEMRKAVRRLPGNRYERA